MITGFILGLLVTLGTALLSALPSIPVPSWLTGAGDAFAKVYQAAGSMSVWFPTGFALVVLVAYLSIKGIGFAIKLSRIVASFMTGGGGSAA